MTSSRRNGASSPFRGRVFDVVEHMRRCRASLVRIRRRTETLRITTVGIWREGTEIKPRTRAESGLRTRGSIVAGPMSYGIIRERGMRIWATWPWICGTCPPTGSFPLPRNVRGAPRRVCRSSTGQRAVTNVFRLVTRIPCVPRHSECSNHRPGFNLEVDLMARLRARVCYRIGRWVKEVACTLVDIRACAWRLCPRAPACVLARKKKSRGPAHDARSDTCMSGALARLNGRNETPYGPPLIRNCHFGFRHNGEAVVDLIGYSAAIVTPRPRSMMSPIAASFDVKNRGSTRVADDHRRSCLGARAKPLRARSTNCDRHHIRAAPIPIPNATQVIEADHLEAPRILPH